MTYSGEQLREIIFPLGGIGTGSVGLCGNGRLMDWEIFNHPDKGSYNGYTHIAVRAEYPDGRAVAKVLVGDTNRDWMGKYSKGRSHSYGYGADTYSMAGFPHFCEVTFDGEFPFAKLTFRDPGFPADVILTAFNPFIPLDSENSSLPVALFDVSVVSREPGVRYLVVFSLRNPFPSSQNAALSEPGFSGVFLRPSALPATDVGYGDLTLAVRGGATVQEYWYRGDWHDGITTFWNELTAGSLRQRSYDEPGKGDTCSVGVTVSPEVGAPAGPVFALAWNCPVRRNDWSAPYLDSDGKEITWKNYYATRFASSKETAVYALTHYETLRRRSDAFRRALFSSSLDPVLLDAISANLSVLKSPTVLRLEDGTFYGWEGVFEQVGSCEGTCTHVWSYAYALCFLFPDLERSIRETEFFNDLDADGRMDFRTKLPLGRKADDPWFCLDGQMASVFKAYREWKIAGDDEWLRRVWEPVKRSLAFAWSEKNPHGWDRDRDGVLEGRQHHTLDVELFGPSSWLEGMYLAALRAAKEMAEYLGDPMAAEYARLYENGRRFLNENLFNGRYFQQQVDLNDRSLTERFGCPQYWNAERGELKYQIGEGSEIDQMLGQWHADLLGLGNIFDPDPRRRALRHMMEHNFKPRIGDVANLWRNFAVDGEAGTVICDYTGARRPAIPIPYSEECMTGFEYAFAGLLFAEGFYDDGLRVVKAVRDRYDGKKRNPYNEIECGSNYARSMASFALLPILSGFTFDLPRGEIGFRPYRPGDFRSFWSLAPAWGVFERVDGSATVRVEEGALTLSRLSLGDLPPVVCVTADGKEIPFRVENGAVLLEAPVKVRRELAVTFGGQRQDNR